MLTWCRQAKLAGCHLRRTHLEDLHARAIAGYSVPVVVTWEGVGWVGETPWKGDVFRVRASSLAELEAEVGHKTLAALRLTVSLASTPNEPRVEVTMGDLETPQGVARSLFLGLLWVVDSRWYTQLRVYDHDVAAARDRMEALKKVLMRSQGVRRLVGGWPEAVHVIVHTTLLWFFINYVGLDQRGDRYLFGGIALAATALISWQLFVDWLARTRLRVTPAPMMWWQHLTTSPWLYRAVATSLVDGFGRRPVPRMSDVDEFGRHR
ncbi:hypothetical protein, partial [Streptomyces pseudogriseolus]|uniref:hypothetical protein n=1 Tax=Streptomyces pseudogriseolus TaxID=36817 RepID=UPI003FA2DF7D